MGPRYDGKCASSLFRKKMEHHASLKPGLKKHRMQYSADKIKEVTVDARHLGHPAAAKKHKIPEETVWTWLSFYMQHQKYFEPEARGANQF